MPCENPEHTSVLEKLDGSKVCATCRSNPASWEPPFIAVLSNEAGEPHYEVELSVCPEKIERNGLRYRLVEFSRDGAAYAWCAFVRDYRCPKCGAEADERFDCCQVHAETAGK